MVKLELHAPRFLDPQDLTYVIIGTREGENWIFVRHAERSTWELPAGHIEAGEDVLAAARRELFEETGVLRANLTELHDYTVHFNGKKRNGRLFFASVKERIALPDSEIAEIRISPYSPEPATYPEVHWKFVQILNDFIDHSINDVD